MKEIVLFTQRVEVVEKYQERRDCTDQQWTKFLYGCGYLPVAVPNSSEVVEGMLEKLNPKGIVFTGGNDLVAYGGNAPERDATEADLLKWAIFNQVPVLGVCRGMQVIQSYFGGKLERVSGHVRARHRLQFEGDIQMVNSFHNMGILECARDLTPLASCEDGVVEAMKHETYPIYAIMWHPEREAPFLCRDQMLLKNLMGKGN